MTITELGMSIIASSNNTATYLKIGTPILDREELHKHPYPLLDMWSFEPMRFDRYMSDIANDMLRDAAFEKRLIQNMKTLNRKKNDNE